MSACRKTVAVWLWYGFNLRVEKVSVYITLHYIRGRKGLGRMCKEMELFNLEPE